MKSRRLIGSADLLVGYQVSAGSGWLRNGRLSFSRVAGEIVLPPGESVTIAAGTEDDAKFGQHLQFARSPYNLGFQAGSFKFKLCSVHIHYGGKSGKHRRVRVAEISRLAQLLKQRSDDERELEVKFAKSQKVGHDARELHLAG